MRPGAAAQRVDAVGAPWLSAPTVTQKRGQGQE